MLRKNEVYLDAMGARPITEYRYFFFVTNDRQSTPMEIVLLANERCDRENLIEQFKNGVKALRNPLPAEPAAHPTSETEVMQVMRRNPHRISENISMSFRLKPYILYLLPHYLSKAIGDKWRLGIN